MHSKTNSSCVFTSITAVTVLGLSWFLAYKYRLTAYSPGSRKECQLIIGILSARGNTEQRRAIRSTWLPDPKNATSCVHTYFVIGQDACQIPPEDRLDEYNCKPWELNLTTVGDAKTIHFSSVAAPSYSSKPVSMGLRFQVQHSIVVTKLGVLGSLAQSGNSISAILQTTVTQEEVARVTLSPLNIGISANGYFYRPIEPLILPKGFEGSLLLSAVDLSHNLEDKVNTTYNDGGGLISFQQIVVEAGIEQPFSHHLISVVSLGFTVYDLQTLKLHVEEQSTREENWLVKMQEEASLLQDEMLKQSDILVVNVTDVYRNLPLKLLLFYEWVQEQYNFDYLLKADDDCVLNVDQVKHFLASISAINKFWWGRFRYNWLVQRSGKWREVHFGAIAYPPFACGVANVISSDIIHWIAKNLRELHNYQGEDVSVGIWLSAISPTYIHDTNWQCDDGCQKNALSRGQLKPNDIHRSWAMFIQCGQFCNCDL